MDLDRDAWKIIKELFLYARKLKEINSELVPGLEFGVWLGFKISGRAPWDSP